MIKKTLLFGKTFHTDPKQLSDIQLFNHISDHLDDYCFTCPHCGKKGCFDRVVPYDRWIITVENDERKEYRVECPSLVCECGHWHAVLSDILIPYSSYTARFILHVLNQYIHRTCTVVELCGKWQIAVSTLYTWIHRFKDHYSLWAGIMGEIRRITQAALDEVCSYVDFARAFLERIGAFSFLQGYCATYSDPRPDPIDSS